MLRYTLFISTPQAPEDFEEVSEGSDITKFLAKCATYEECGYNCVIWSHILNECIYESRGLTKEKGPY